MPVWQGVHGAFAEVPARVRLEAPRLGGSAPGAALALGARHVPQSEPGAAKKDQSEYADCFAHRVLLLFPFSSLNEMKPSIGWTVRDPDHPLRLGAHLGLTGCVEGPKKFPGGVRAWAIRGMLGV